MKASENSGYIFSSWTSNTGGTFANANSPSTTFIMPAANVTLTARFTNSGGGGIVTPTPIPASKPILTPILTPTSTPTSTPTPSPESGTKKDGNTTFESITVKATTDSTTGTASAKIEANAFNTLVDKAKKDDASGRKTVVEIKVESASGAKGVEVSILNDAFKQRADISKADLKVETAIGTVTFNAKAVKSISDAVNSGNISINITKIESSSLTQEAQAMVGDKLVYDFFVKAGNAEVSKFELREMVPK